MSVSNRTIKKSGLWIDLPPYERSYSETMVAELWLNNNQRHYDLLREACRRYKNAYDCADWLKNQLYERLNDVMGEPSLWSDLLTAAFARVNWEEIIQRNR